MNYWRCVKGFTLLEMMVSISIIALITAIFLVNYHSTNQVTSFANALQKLSSDIRVAQNNSLGSKDFNGTVPRGGWGAHFNMASSSQYIIFADINGNGQYDAGEEYQITNFAQNVGISSTSPAGPLLDITFRPPDPTTLFNGTSTISNAAVNIKDTVNNLSKTVEVNFLGMIDLVN